jgi:hypothetical protein
VTSLNYPIIGKRKTLNLLATCPVHDKGRPVGNCKIPLISDTLGDETVQKKKKLKAKTEQSQASTSALSVEDVSIEELDCNRD